MRHTKTLKFAELSHQGQLKLDPFICAEHLLICSGGHYWFRNIWNGQGMLLPCEVFCKDQYPAAPFLCRVAGRPK